MNITLKDKIILITGASSGIGKLLAVRFAKEGATIIINYNNNYDGAMDTLNLVNQYSNNSIIAKANIMNESDIKDLYKLVYQRYGYIDILINNAGKLFDNTIEDISFDQWSEVINLNLNGSFLCTKYMIRLLYKSKLPKIFYISSIMSNKCRVNQSNYSASKAGLIALSNTAAKEFAKYKVSVNAICPGFIETNLNRDNSIKKFKAYEDSLLKFESSKDDLANFLILLCSESVRGVSGQVFYIDDRL